jgi:AcrR family transcriptional regulator
VPAVPRAGLNTDSVVDVALAIVDEQGPEALSLSVVAARAGVAAPSLYKHVTSLAELRSRVAARVLAEMTEVATTAVLGLSGDAAVAALMRRLRAYGVEYPARYLSVPPDPMHDPALALPAARLVEVFLAVLREYDLHGAAAIHATRCLRVIVHGFASIESSGGFGLAEDPAETYEQLIQMYLASLPPH